MPTSNITGLTFDDKTNIFKLSYTGDTLNVAMLGCGGTGDKHQQNTADALASLKESDSEPDFVIMLGDTFYDWRDNGLTSPKQLDNQLIQMYKQMAVPFFCIDGNHEKWIHGKSKFVLFDQTEKAQRSQAIWHDFTDPDPAKELPDSFAGTSNPTLTIDNLAQQQPADPENAASAAESDSLTPQIPTKKFLASRPGYYSIICTQEKLPSVEASKSRSKKKAEETTNKPKVEYICLDSNSLPYDKEQQKWLTDRLKNSEADEIIICQHHPILSYGKRRYDTNDAKKYYQAYWAEQNQDDEDLEIALNDRFNYLKGQYGGSQNDHVKGVFKDEILKHTPLAQQAKIRGFFAAHDHNNQIIAGRQQNQFIIGNAGAKSDPVHYAREGVQKNKLHYSTTKTGFTVVKHSTGQDHTSVKGFITDKLNRNESAQAKLVTQTTITSRPSTGQANKVTSSMMTIVIPQIESQTPITYQVDRHKEIVKTATGNKAIIKTVYDKTEDGYKHSYYASHITEDHRNKSITEQQLDGFRAAIQELNGRIDKTPMPLRNTGDAGLKQMDAMEAITQICVVMQKMHAHLAHRLSQLDDPTCEEALEIGFIGSEIAEELSNKFISKVDQTTKRTAFESRKKGIPLEYQDYVDFTNTIKSYDKKFGNPHYRVKKAFAVIGLVVAAAAAALSFLFPPAMPIVLPVAAKAGAACLGVLGAGAGLALVSKKQSKDPKTRFSKAAKELGPHISLFKPAPPAKEDGFVKRVKDRLRGHTGTYVLTR